MWTVCTQELLRGTVLGSIFCVIKSKAIFKKHSCISDYFCEWLYVIKNFKSSSSKLLNSCCDEKLQQNIREEAIFRKSCFHIIKFFLKLRGSDGKAKVVSKFLSFFSTANLGGLVKVFLDWYFSPVWPILNLLMSNGK